MERSQAFFCLLCLLGYGGMAQGGPIALVIRTHKSTRRLQAAAILARTQIEDCGGYFRILLRTSSQSAAEVNTTLHHLRGAVGALYIEHVVTQDIRRELPGYIEGVIKFEEESKYSKGSMWEWSAGDIGDYLFYLRMVSTMPSWIQHIWFMEYDVGWTGNIATICSTLFDNTSDYIGYQYRSAECNTTHGWSHCGEHNWLAADQMYTGLGAINRVSRRLLDAIIHHLKLGHFAYSEATAPSVCSGVYGDWCTAYAAFNERHTAIAWEGQATLFAWDVKVSPELWARHESAFAARAVLNSSLGGQLYHALKW